MYGSFRCGHSKKPSNRMIRGDSYGCGYGCRTCKNARTLKWHRKQPETYFRAQKVRLRKEQIDPLLKAQHNCCAICKRKMKYPYADHSHKCCPIGTKGCTKCRRGLLCPSCNGGLHLIESKRLHKAAIKYLKKWETQWNKKNT